ncbi:MAG: DUF4443 domain-containing protein [Nanoarchaeota archaeon]|nr:DUF4443 domain-containing protein [Nanoarchaeota archaeon]
MVGNKCNYDALDIIRVFLSIDGEKPRKELCHTTGLGEGSVKGILNLLKEKAIMDSSRKGHFLTRKGRRLRNEIRNEISEIKNAKLGFFKGLKSAALVVKNSKSRITYKVRDIAIRTGAEVALLFKFDKKLFMPQCEQDLINTSELDLLFDYSDGDILIVVFADNIKIVEKALLNVAVALNKKLSRLNLRITG